MCGSNYAAYPSAGGNLSEIRFQVSCPTSPGTPDQPHPSDRYTVNQELQQRFVDMVVGITITISRMTHWLNPQVYLRRALKESG